MRTSVALLLALLLPGCFNSGSTLLPNGEHELGRKIYNFRCYYCHGYSGDARTLASTYLAPPPRDFTATPPQQLSREQMLQAIADGRPGTAMKGFAGILQPAEIAAVADFVRQEFMIDRAVNTRYHTKANGWADHEERYAAAFPFITGEVPLDTPGAQLSPAQKAGRQLFMSACISCHDRAKVIDEGAPWELRPLSYPRNGHKPGDGYAPGSELKLDGITSASPYLLHDRIPQIPGLTPREQRGESLYQLNCAFCHAADGTGRNWIGSFLEPHPRDLTDAAFMSGMTRQRLAGVIREGLPGTSMPAWKSVLAEEEIQDLIAYVARAFHPLD